MEASAVEVAVGAALTFLVNLPFGYWRAGARKLSLHWFAAVHAPVPLVAAYRILAGVPVKLIPVFMAAYFLGQAAGARVRRLREG